MNRKKEMINQYQLIDIITSNLDMNLIVSQLN